MSAAIEANSISRRAKIFAFAALWSVALFATNPTGSLWPLVYMFPMGLLQFLYRPAMRDGGWGTLIFCFAIYLVHACFYFRSRSKRSTLIWFAILILLLVCNVSGCREMNTAH